MGCFLTLCFTLQAAADGPESAMPDWMAARESEGIMHTIRKKALLTNIMTLVLLHYFSSCGSLCRFQNIVVRVLCSNFIRCLIVSKLLIHFRHRQIEHGQCKFKR